MSSASQHLSAAFPGSLVLAGQAHQRGQSQPPGPQIKVHDRPWSWDPSPCHRPLCPQGTGLVTRAKCPQRLLGCNPHVTLGTVHSRSGQKEEDATVRFCSHRAGPFSCTLPPARAAAAQAGTGHSMNKHHVCLQALPKTVAGLNPACLGALALGGSSIWVGRWTRGGHWQSWPPLRPVQGRLAQHCRVLSASSLTGSPQGGSQTDGGPREGELSYVTKAQKRWARGPDKGGPQALYGDRARARSLTPPHSWPLLHGPALVSPPAHRTVSSGSWSKAWRLRLFP